MVRVGHFHTKHIGSSKMTRAIFSPAPGVTWAVDIYYISLVQIERHRQLRLSYPDAMLWDLIYRRVPMQRVIALVTALAVGERGAAEKWIDNKIAQWINEEWLIAGEVHG
jgi:hypothetical protein